MDATLRLRILGTAVAATLIATRAPGATLTVIDDGELLPADYFEFGNGAGTADSNRFASGGNPGAYVTHGMQVLGGQEHTAGSLNVTASYDPSSQGAVARASVSYDFRRVDFGSPGLFGDGTVHGVAVQQGGTLYRHDLGDSSGIADWTGAGSLDITGAFDQVDWTGGGPINFGFYSHLRNVVPSTDLKGVTGFDNFNVAVEFAPELGVPGTGAQHAAWGGGAGNTGGVDLRFTNVTTPGTVRVNDAATLPDLGGSGFGLDFSSTGGVPVLWDIDFDGAFSGPVELVFGYDESRVVGPESELSITHLIETTDGFGGTSYVYEDLGGVVDTVNDTITVTTDSFSPFALGTAVPDPTTTVEYAFDGSVTGFSGNLGSAVSVGDPFHASLAFDPGQATLDVDGGVERVYGFPGGTGAYRLDVTLGGFAGSGSDGRVNILDQFQGTQDWFKTSSNPADGFAGDPIAGLTWKQTTITLKDLDGTLYSDTSLPNEIAELNAFEEAFATLFTDGSGFVNADIDSIAAVLSNRAAAVLTPETPEAVLDPAADGGLVVTLPAATAGTFTASYNQQAASEVDLSALDFFIAGDVFQTWDLEFDGTLAPGDLVELVFTYDDTGMSLFDELTLDILHFVGGAYVPLNGVVDPIANTITAFTPGFSSFALGSTAVPEPASAVLAVLGLAGLAGRRRRGGARRRSRRTPPG